MKPKATTSKTPRAPHVPVAAHPRSVPNVAPARDDVREAEQPFAEGARDALDADLRYRLISEAAYALYTARGYADGYDVDDWLTAEAEVDHLLLGRAGGVA
ncbi:MAG: DUF2934 domain-containing protein [Betaproteobacteria bacterium]|nr:DUF2934 domain-containing protein [Betaproteobacteria bacterium]